MKYLILICLVGCPLGFAFADDQNTDPTFSKPSIFDEGGPSPAAIPASAPEAVAPPAAPPAAAKPLDLDTDVQQAKEISD